MTRALHLSSKGSMHYRTDGVGLHVAIPSCPGEALSISGSAVDT